MSGPRTNRSSATLKSERSAWVKTVAAAERHYDPGTFTTFAGLEYGFTLNSQGLHRNVIFRGEPPETPFRARSRNPEKLWEWMDHERVEGRESLAIPHNMNVSNGLMFNSKTFEGLPLDAEYAALRMRNEPLVEIAQVKGASETPPAQLAERRVGRLRDLPVPVGNRDGRQCAWQLRPRGGA